MKNQESFLEVVDSIQYGRVFTQKAAHIKRTEILGEANDLELTEDIEDMIKECEEELSHKADNLKNEQVRRELQDKIYYLKYMKKTGKRIIEIEK